MPNVSTSRRPTPQRVFLAGDRHAGGELSFQPVRGHAMHAAIAGIVGRSDRVCEHLHAGGGRHIDDRAQQAGRAHALAVIRNQDDFRPRQGLWKLGVQPGDGGGRNRVARLVIHPDHLLGVPILRPADIALLERGRPIVQRQDQPVVDPLLRQASATSVAPRRPDRLLLPSEPAPPARAASSPRWPPRPADARAGRPQERNRRFLADPFGETPDVPVQHQVADDHDPRAAQPLQPPYQIRRHALALRDRAAGTCNEARLRRPKKTFGALFPRQTAPGCRRVSLFPTVPTAYRSSQDGQASFTKTSPTA